MNQSDLMNRISKLEEGILPGNVEVAGNLTVTGALTGSFPVEAVTDATRTVLAAESGTIFVQTRSSTTCIFTLPTPAAGLTYTFVCGHASSEILFTPGTGKAIITKIHSAQDGTGLAPAAGTGIKNTAATNVIGDSITLVALNTTTWYGTSIIGLWASR